MLQPDLAAGQVAATLAQETARIALPLNPANGERRQFGSLFEEVRREVSDFIADGSTPIGTSLAGATSLSAEGYAQRAMLKDAGTNAPSVDLSQQQAFITSIAPWARDAAERLGVDPELVAAHAALESGWGQRPLRNVDGTLTHNLFGVKAGNAWTGEAVRALTTEVDDGIASKRTETFRSYDDQAHAFGDYTRLLLDNSRYGAALNVGADAGAFAQGLVKGRYATDPDYAQKIERVTRTVREIGLPSATVPATVR